MSLKSKPSPFKKSQREMQPSVLRQAMIRKLPNRLSGKGEMLLPAIPSLVDHYVQGLDATWRGLGRNFTPSELEYLKEVLGKHLKQAFDASPYSRVSVSYETDQPPKTSLTWTIAIVHSTIEQEYAQWVATRTPPLFGELPDSKVMELARSLGRPEDVTVLDVGAGTGRNTLPLAREGFRVEALELAPALAEVLKQDVEKEKLNVAVHLGSILDDSLSLPENHYKMVFLSEVVSHFRSGSQLRKMFEVAMRSLCSGGHLLFNTFIAMDGYKPDDMAREMSEIMWCRVFTRNEVNEAAAGLLRGISDESALEYERAHCPADKWPPTGWYEGWSAGQDAFDLNASKVPMEIRWLVFQKP